MAGIGSLFEGIAQGLQAGIQLRQNQQRIGLAAESLDLERQKQELAIMTLQNGLLDARTQAQALAPMAQAEQADAKLFSWMSDMRNAINADPGTRKAQLPVFAQQFKAATGRDLAPNVLEAFSRGDSATLTRALDDATQQILAKGTSAQDIAGLLTDPVRSAKWFASASARAAAAGEQPDIADPGASSLATQVGILNRQATYADQRVEALVATLPNMRTQAGVDKVNSQIQFWQQRGDTMRTKVAELSKPVSSSAGSTTRDPVTGEVLYQNAPKSDVLSPEAEAQRIRIAAANAQSRADASQGAMQETWTPEAVDTAAETYRLTGQLPAVGYGMAGYKVRAKIANRAAEMAQADGEDAQSAALRRVANVNIIAGNRQLRAQQAKLSAFERTAVKNADLALKASEELDRTGVPYLNKLFIKTEKAVDDNPQVARLQLFTLGFRNEFARIVTGATGVTSDTARAEVDNVLQAYMGKMSFAAAIEAAKQEMKNRIEGFNEQNKADMEALQVQPETPAGDGGGAPAIARPKSKEDYDALPDGQPYIAPDGSRRIKGQ